MFIADDKQPSARTAPGPKPSVKLYSIFALQRDKAFTGEFETSKSKHQFTFAPQSARLENGKLQLLGTFTIGTIGTRKVQNVIATLVSTQGGLGTAPPAINARPVEMTPGLPLTEFTDARSFVGALYFQLSPIKASPLQRSGRGASWAAQLEFDFFANQRRPLVNDPVRRPVDARQAKVGNESVQTVE